MSKKTRKPNMVHALAAAVELQRARLMQIRAIVDSNARLLHESREFEIGEADLAYCADVVSDMLGRVVAALEPLSTATAIDERSTNPAALEREIAAHRQQLFWAQAVARAIENLLKIHALDEDDAKVEAVFRTISEMLEQVISALDPSCFGLSSIPT